jgi:hypothetical protein
MKNEEWVLAVLLIEEIKRLRDLMGEQSLSLLISQSLFTNLLTKGPLPILYSSFFPLIPSTARLYLPLHR